VIAVGYNNEIGNGFMSYSEADRQRFIAWLKKKYGTIEELNKAWATQRWSRRLNSFEDVDLPLADGPGPPSAIWISIAIGPTSRGPAGRTRCDSPPQYAGPSSDFESMGYAPRRGFDYLSDIQVLCLLWR
jgi:beta-galactosidase